eukprot:8569418-Pyramimonas_sp.AAC.1
MSAWLSGGPGQSGRTFAVGTVKLGTVSMVSHMIFRVGTARIGIVSRAADSTTPPQFGQPAAQNSARLVSEQSKILLRLDQDVTFRRPRPQTTLPQTASPRSSLFCVSM